MKLTYRFTDERDDEGRFPRGTYELYSNPWVENLEKGDRVIVYSESREGSGKEVFYIRPDNGSGIPGNMNSNIRRYHGWRGTTDGVSVYAYGCYSIKSVERITRPHWWDRTKPPVLVEIVVQINRTDLKKNEE